MKDSIKEYLIENDNKSIIFKATFDENEVIQEPFFLSLYKKKTFEETLTKVKRDEVVIRITKPNQLYPNDLELELSEELFNRRNRKTYGSGKTSAGRNYFGGNFTITIKSIEFEKDTTPSIEC